MIEHIHAAANFLRKQGIDSPEIGVILGTGLGNLFVEQIQNKIVIDYGTIHIFLYLLLSLTVAN